jgi:threonine/homoserine/homoserine lactone efflux protein
LATRLAAHRSLFEVAAGMMLLALGLWLAARAWRPPAGPRIDAATPRVSPASVFMLTLANPLTILLFAGFSGQLALAQRWQAAAGYATALFLGSLAVQVVYALLGASLQRIVRDAAAWRLLNAASGIGIAAFGAYGLRRALWGS